MPRRVVAVLTWDRPESDLGTESDPRRGWNVSARLRGDQDGLHVSLFLGARASGLESCAMLGFTLEEAKGVARALGMEWRAPKRDLEAYARAVASTETTS